MAAGWTHWVYGILCSLKFIILMAGTAEAQDGSPIVVDWSSKTYGPDGPWYALNVSFGTPPQFVDMIFSHLRASWPIASTGCDPGEACPAQKGGYYNYKLSTTKVLANDTIKELINEQEFQSGGSFERPTVSITATTTPLSDTTRLYSNGSTIEVESCGIMPLENPLAVPDTERQNYPLTLGGFSIGTAIDRLSYDTTDWPNHELISSLYMQKRIPSNSFTYTAGSPTVGIPPQLVLGGYDASRVMSSPIYEPIADGVRFFLNLTAVGLGTDHGEPAYKGGNQHNLLRNSSGLIARGIQAPINLMSSYITLPLETCQELAKYLPIHPRSDYGLYVWDTKDPAYHKILSRPSYLYFEFNHIQGVWGYGIPELKKPRIIRIPLRLLVLTLESPILLDPPLTYFPCAPSSEPRVQLGRAFFQAAVLGINWRVSTDVQSWVFVAQASGPVIGNMSKRAISPGLHSISPAKRRNSFSASWKGYWNHFQPPKPTPTPPGSPGTIPPAPSDTSEPKSSDGSLSIGADVGIGVGSAVALILIVTLISCLFLRSRRRRKAKAQARERSSSSSPDPSPSNNYESPDPSQIELETVPMKIYELPGNHSQPGEMESPPVSPVFPVSPLSPSFEMGSLDNALQPPSYSELASGTMESNNSDPSEMEVPRSVEKSGFLVC